MTARLRGLAFGLIVAYLVAVPLLFSVFTIESFEFPKVLLLRVVAWGLLSLGGVALVDALGHHRMREIGRAVLRTARRDPIVLAASGWLVSGALSTATSLSPHVSLWGANKSFAGLATLASYAVLFAATRVVARSVADLRLVLAAAFAAGVGTTTYGVLQLSGLDPLAWGNAQQSGGLVRIASTMGNPNFLGGYLAMVFPVGVCLAASEYRRGARIGPIVIGLALTASAIVSLSTLSRGVAIAYVAGIGTLVVGWWRTGQRASFAWLLGAIATLLLSVGVYAVTTETGRSYTERAQVRLARTLNPQRDLRIEFWAAALSMARSEPVLGVGLDAFGLAFPRHARPSFRRRVPEATPARAHDELLHTAATQGAVGVAAGLFFVCALAMAWLRALRRATDDEERMLLIAVGAAICALLARNLVSFTIVGVGGFASVLAGLLAGRAYADSEPRCTRAVSRRGLAGAIGVGVTIAATCFWLNSLWDASGTPVGAFAASAAIAGVVGCLALGLGLRSARSRGEHAASGPARSPGSRTMASVLGTVAVAVVFIAAVVQTVVRPAAADIVARQGNWLMDRQRPERAVASFERAVRWDPCRDIHWIELGIAYHAIAASDGVGSAARRRHIALALAAHLRAAQLVPAQAVNQANVGRGFAELAGWTDANDPDEYAQESARSVWIARAYARFDKALDLDPYNRSIYFDATKAARGFRDERALSRYAAAWRDHHPTHAQAKAQLGIAAMMRRDWTAAEAELLAANELNWAGALSDQVGNWVNLASTQLELHEANDARASSDAALALVPHYLPALRTRALAFESLAAAAAAKRDGTALLDRSTAAAYRRLAAADWAERLAAVPDDAEAREALQRLEIHGDRVHDPGAARTPGEVER